MGNAHKIKRRYRQIARLIYYYCCVRYMKRENGKWVIDAQIHELLKELKGEI